MPSITKVLETKSSHLAKLLSFLLDMTTSLQFNIQLILSLPTFVGFNLGQA
ncbi:hypothetical protein HN51_070277 [Arachis hypogaea]